MVSSLLCMTQFEHKRGMGEPWVSLSPWSHRTFKPIHLNIAKSLRSLHPFHPRQGQLVSSRNSYQLPASLSSFNSNHQTEPLTGQGSLLLQNNPDNPDTSYLYTFSGLNLEAFVCSQQTRTTDRHRHRQHKRQPCPTNIDVSCAGASSCTTTS